MSISNFLKTNFILRFFGQLFCLLLFWKLQVFCFGLTRTDQKETSTQNLK